MNVYMHALSAVDCGFEPRSGQTKDDLCCFFVKQHATLRSKSKDWLARNQNNASASGTTCLPLFQ